MTRINTSRQAVSAMQRNCTYKASGAIAQHVINATVELDSTDPVLYIDSKFLVASKFSNRYYTCKLVRGQWTCSSQDASVAARCIAQARAFRQSW